MNNSIKFQRRQFMKATVASLGALATNGIIGCTQNKLELTNSLSCDTRPNILLILTDDQGYGDMACHGNKYVKTPMLDQMYKESSRFTQFYASPVCAPTRASLMTGRYNYRTGVWDTYLGRDLMNSQETTIAELLANAGYATGIFGKWHLGDNYPMRPIDQGFSEALVHKGGGIGQVSDPPGNSYYDPILDHNGVDKKYSGYCTDIFTEASISFINENKNKPFFAYVSFNAPHEPFEIDENLAVTYQKMGLNNSVAKLYAMIENIDSNIKKIFNKLDELKLTKDTVVIFMGDNGPWFGALPGTPPAKRYNAGLRGYKGTVYEGGIKVPCFIHWPGKFEAGKAINNIAAHIDILPTILDICKVKKPSSLNLDGISLLPLLTDRNVKWPDRTLYFQWAYEEKPTKYRNCAARSQRYKLVQPGFGVPVDMQKPYAPDNFELYDIQNDPYESNNIAKENQKIVRKMCRDYEAWFDDVSNERGFNPAAIIVGSRHQNPVTLTRQEWFGPRAGWSDDSLGHWKINIKKAGQYNVLVRTSVLENINKVKLSINGTIFEKTDINDTSKILFRDIILDEGECLLKADLFLTGHGDSIGPDYVDVELINSDID